MRLIKVPAFLSAALLAASVFGSTFEERAAILIDRMAESPIPTVGGTGVLGYGPVIARLAQTGGQDPTAINFTVNSGYGGEIFFNSSLQLRALYMARDFLTEADLATLQARASSASNNWGNTGTENHRKMTWVSAYLLAQLLPDALWNWGGESITSATMMNRVKNLLIEVGRNEYAYGYSEFLSPVYQLYHVAPMANLYDYAEDLEVKAIADAFLNYHFSVFALGSFEEVTLPPWSRRGPTMDRGLNGPESQLLSWLMFGHGNFTEDNSFAVTRPLIFFAVSDWRPSEVIQSIATRQFTAPFTMRSQQPHFQWGTTRYVMRTTYQHPRVAMSSGVIRHIPAAFMLDDAQFMIAWEGNAPVKQITAFHPYWRSATEGEDYWQAPTSPFMQTGQHENAAIMLYDIPAEDPWPRSGRQEWWSARDGPMIPLAQVRYPGHMIYSRGDANWVFLRDGGVYVAIYVLKEGWSRDRRSVSEIIGGSTVAYEVLKSRGTSGERWQTGFIFQIATVDEYPEFVDFQAAVQALPVSVDWETMEVAYTTLSGDVLNLRYNDSMETPDLTIPFFSINNTPVAYDSTWPSLQSPWINIENRIMTVKEFAADGTVGDLVAAIDWSDSVPVFSTSSEIPTWAGYPILESGWVDTGDFLGLIYPEGDFVYLPSFDFYIYLPESFVVDSGGWMFIPSVMP